MVTARKYRHKSRRLRLVFAGAIALSFLLVGYMLIGPTGLYALQGYEQKIVAKQGEYDSLAQEKARLRNRVDLLDHRRADPDIADELVRKELGVVHPDEIIIPLVEQDSPTLESSRNPQNPQTQQSQ